MSKKNITPINKKIRAEEVMLIGSNGEKMGILSFSEALNIASSASLDLVQVSPSDANPVVCKLLDYGKHLFDKKKSITSSKVKVKRNTTKEIKFRPSTDVGDYNIKLKKIKSFILDGDKTKISGGQRAHGPAGGGAENCLPPRPGQLWPTQSSKYPWAGPKDPDWIRGNISLGDQDLALHPPSLPASLPVSRPCPTFDHRTLLTPMLAMLSPA